MATPMKNAPHCDKKRTTAEGAWITLCRLRAGLAQCELAPVLRGIEPGLGNPGRVSEFETGKRLPSPEVMKGLGSFFRQRLGATCPPLP